MCRILFTYVRGFTVVGIFTFDGLTHVPLLLQDTAFIFFYTVKLHVLCFTLYHFSIILSFHVSFFLCTTSVSFFHFTYHFYSVPLLALSFSSVLFTYPCFTPDHILLYSPHLVSPRNTPILQGVGGEEQWRSNPDVIGVII